MRRAAIRVAVIVGLIAATGLAAPSSVPDSTAIDTTFSNRLTFNFGKNVENDDWSGAIRYVLPAADGWSLDWRQSSSLILHTQSGGRRHWKSDQDVDFRLAGFRRGLTALSLAGEGYQFEDRLPPLIPAGSGARSLFPYDQHTDFIAPSPITNGGAFIQRGFLGVGVAAASDFGLSANFNFGPAFERHGDMRLGGMSLRSEAEQIVTGGGLAASARLDRIGEFHDNSWSGRLYGDRALPGGGDDRYSAETGGSSLREYPTSGGDPRRRRDASLALANHLASDPSAPLALFWDSQLRRRQTTHEGGGSDINDRESVWENKAGLVWRSGRTVGLASGGMDFQYLNYELAPSQGRRTRLGLRMTLKPRFLDSLAFDIQAIGYRYDTPAGDLNDRDELRYIASVEAGSEPLTGLGLWSQLSADVHHLVYVHRPRSSDNRWMRLFTLACSLPWNDQPLANRARFAVAANYSDYDYMVATDLSRVYRSFTASDTLCVYCSPRFSLQSEFALLVDDNGRLRWSDWTEDVSEKGYGWILAIRPGCNISPFTSMSAGWTWHRRESKVIQTAGADVPAESVRSSGPTLALESRRSDGTGEVEFTGSWLTVRDATRGRYHIPDVRLRMSCGL